jgi:hypothetical protein
MSSNVRISRMSRTLGPVLLTLVGIPAGCDQSGGQVDVDVAAESALTVSNSDPTGLLPGTVRVPGGRLMDSACVHQVPNGASIDGQGNVSVNGNIIAHYDPCTAAQMNIQPAGDVEPPGIYHAWIENTDTTAVELNGLAQFNYLNASWKVPQSPSEYSSQLLYFFPSFQDLTESQEIIQPVLQFGPNGSWGGNYWTIACWYLSPTNTYTSPALTVYPGDSLYGTLGVYTPGNWNAELDDGTLSHATAITTNVYEKFQTAESGVLEVWNVSDCSQFPPDGSIVFDDVEISQAGPSYNSVNWVQPTWRLQLTSGLTPQCGYNVVERSFTDGNGRPANNTTLWY